jgi:hypothetical protein
MPSTRLFAVFAVSLLMFSSHADAECKNFTQSTDYYTEPATAVQRISQGYVCDAPNSNYEIEIHTRCNPTTQCPYYYGGFVSGQGTNNLSLSEDNILSIYALIPTKTIVKSEPFLYSYSSDLGNNNTGCFDVQPRNSSSISAGFYGFTPNLICVDGTLSDVSI